MKQKIQVERFTDEGKPILELKENETNYWVAEGLEILPQEQKLADKLDGLDALDIWKELIGQQIQNYITDARMYKGILYVKLKSAPLKNELSFKKTELINQINTKLGKEWLKDIILQ